MSECAFCGCERCASCARCPRCQGPGPGCEACTRERDDFPALSCRKCGAPAVRVLLTIPCPPSTFNPRAPREVVGAVDDLCESCYASTYGVAVRGGGGAAVRERALPYNLAPRRWALDYRGVGCGGGNIPAPTVRAAVQYASQRGATSFQLYRSPRRPGDSPKLYGQRPSCRYRWRVARTLSEVLA